MKNPESPDRSAPSFLEERARAHVARTVALTLAWLFGALAILLAVLLVAAPTGPARFYVHEARTGDAFPTPTPTPTPTSPGSEDVP